MRGRVVVPVNHRSNGEAIDFEHDVPVLSVGGCPDDPWEVVERWMCDNVSHGVRWSNVGTLVTSDTSGVPSARSMSFAFQRHRVIFDTHLGSRKANDIQENAAVCVHFYWPEMRRQLKITGRAELLPVEEAEDSWRKRPASMDLVTVRSVQSTVADSTDIEAVRCEILSSQGPRKLDRPDRYRRFAIDPTGVETWEGNSDRLHVRWKYSRSGGDWQWKRVMLWP